MIDLAISAFSVVFAYLLRFNLNYNLFSVAQVAQSAILLCMINMGIFYLMKTYAGIIRYTSTQDSVRILLAIIIGAIVGFVVNIMLRLGGEEYFIPLSVLIIYGFCNFLFLTSYRVMVKLFFTYVKNLKIDKKKAIVFGAGQSGVITKRTLDHAFDTNIKVIAFIDDDERKVGKILEGIMIYNARQDFLTLIREHAVDQVVISIQNLSVTRKNEIVDICLAHNIKVLNVPPVHRWINGELKSHQIKDINIEDLLDRDTIIIHNDAINEQLRDKHVLITGAAGSIGSELVRQVMKFDPRLVILCDQSETALYELELELAENYPHANFQTYIADVRNLERMEALFRTYKPHHVYHAAAYKHVPLMENHPSEAVLVNVLGTKNVADLSVKYHVQKFVMISTDKAVNPSNVMGASKRIAEIYIQSLNNEVRESKLLVYDSLSHANGSRNGIKNANGGAINSHASANGISYRTKFITTRFGNVLGSNGSVIPRFKSQIEKGGPITVTHPEITRYFMTIPEACQLVLEAGAMGKGGEIFIFDMGQSVKIVELAKKMIALSGFVPHKDIKIVFTGLRPGEKLYEELLNHLENTIPTHHSKIMIAKVREYWFEEVGNGVADLISAAWTSNDEAVVKKMKLLVPEYKSNNSIYEELDAAEALE